MPFRPHILDMAPLNSYPQTGCAVRRYQDDLYENTSALNVMAVGRASATSRHRPVLFWQG